MHNRMWIFCWGLVMLLWTSSFAWAGGPESAELAAAVHSSAEQLRDERPQEAIRELEAFADSGMLHPELSFNRGLAYMRRAGSAAGQSGDYGQAAAGFAETLLQRPDDAEAVRALEEAQLAVSRKRAQGDGAAVTEPLGLFEKALDSLNVTLLLSLAIAGCLLSVVGIVLQRAKRESRRTAGVITLGIGLLILVPSVALAQFRDHLFDDAEVAVVIAAQAPVFDESGKRMPQVAALQESTVVHIGSAQRGMVPLVGWGSKKWIRLGQLRVLRTAAH